MGRKRSAVSRIAVSVSALCIALATGGAATAQSYPARPVRMLAPAVGGGVEIVARLLALKVSASLGQQFIVDNRPAGGGVVAAQTLATARPDGHTLLFFGAPIWLLPLLRTNLPYDLQRDFAPVMMAVSFPAVLVVHSSVPANSVNELIALAKSRPGQLNAAISGTASAPHLSLELLKAMTGINVTLIPYNGVGPTVMAVVGAQADFTMPVLTAAMPHIRSGKLRALAVASAQPTALAPGLPTIAASGVPGYESEAWGALFAPAGTPPAIVSLLNQEFSKALRLPEVREFMANAGAEVHATSPQGAVTIMRNEVAKWGKLIREAGIREN